MTTIQRFGALVMGLGWIAMGVAGVLPVSPARAAEPKAAPLTWDVLANAEYAIGLDETTNVKLVDGQYEAKTGEGASNVITLRMAPVYALGDLNGDGVADAALVYGYNTGGSGVFYDLAAVLNEGGKPVHVASAALGDRSVLRTLIIRAGRIEVELLAVGPNDPFCCPTNKVVRTFALKGQELAQTAEAKVGQGKLPFLTWDVLANLEYGSKNTLGGKAKLKDGVYEAPAGAQDRPDLRLSYDYAAGDLTGGGIPDTAVLLVANPFEDNETHELAVVLSEKGRPVVTNSLPLEDGTQVAGLAIEARQIVVNLLTPGPQDQPGTPTVKAIQRYEVKAGQLVPAVPSTGGEATEASHTRNKLD